jgi:hypothetical protein
LALIAFVSATMPERDPPEFVLRDRAEERMGQCQKEDISMAYDRYDSRRGWREPRSRFSGDYDRGNQRFDREDRDDRGFFERAGDEVASWFGDEDAQRRRQMDSRFDRPEDDHRRSPMGDEDHSRYDRQARFRDEGYRRPYRGGFSGRQDEGRSRPMTGDYGRSGSRDRDEEHRFTGMASTAGSISDPHYSEWRRRQLDELDRDYDDYRRENQSRFDSDFSKGRNTRQTKRQMLGQVREHMDVVGSDEQTVGKVDCVKGDRIILTKNDSEDGKHHSLSCHLVDRVEGDRVILDKPAEEAKKHFSNESRDRALFERDDDRESGPHMLNRSFSGTY